ncbi:MAG: sigma 54-interacting transcriptional regulator [Desulfobacteraceae bacterium]
MEKFAETLLDRENLSLVIDNLKQGIIAHKPDRTITFFNRAAERITGYSRDEVLGRDCHQVFASPFCGDRCSFCNENSPDFTSGTTEYPLTIITKDGQTRQIEMTVSAIQNKEGVFNGVIASFSDLTDEIDLSLKAESMTSFSGIIGKSKAMHDIFRQIKDVAVYKYPVHVSGETGTGKERVANAIHDYSAFGNGIFVPVNCGAIPEGIVESELFGHVKGAFSGAVKDRKGRFELAHKGTLFLDEVAELPLKTQVKILRFLQEGVFERVGGEKQVSVDVRIISATNKNLKEEVRKGNFRQDLFYRLNVIPIKLPPLRERKTDIPILISRFLKETEKEHNDKPPSISKQALDIMLDYHWPGNVRELKNVIQFSVVHSRGGVVKPDDLPMEVVEQAGRPEIMQENEGEKKDREMKQKTKLDPDAVISALEKTGGNKSKAARLLSVGRATLYRFLSRNPSVKQYAEELDQ